MRITESKKITDFFGCNVFNDGVMQKYMPRETYNELKEVTDLGKPLNKELANKVAKAMKEWAGDMGATHYTHWFQPLTGTTAEKHDSFISIDKSGNTVLEFTGSNLRKGEADASSFPSGGIRATFEARGYTVWDCSSPAFIKKSRNGAGILCIPTAFCSYTGEALDKKTPLLRSMEAINREGVRLLKILGVDAERVTANVGGEQEYFLIDRKVYDQRKDLLYTGRTLFGARPPKGQELDDHYFGTFRPRVAAFMKELDEELWKLGILAKTKHNEVAPAQHELAPVFCTTNIAADQNQLTMEIMKKVADRHGMYCLLHEKPFAGVNGSGKHNNWSMSTNTGLNLLEPGQSPHENAQFLLFLCAVIKAVDEYQDMLRISVASAGNDHRLGAAEAPPAVVSMFLGDELTDVLQAIENDADYDGPERVEMKIGVHTMPRIPKDSTDRNRTSPFAFTGNKFEFRMLGSAQSISGPNVILNTAVAEELCQFADMLEVADDFNAALTRLIKTTVQEHKRIIFNGNGYNDEWLAEAEKRGLYNFKTTPDCVPHYLDRKNVGLFTKHRVFTETEMHARYEIHLENYCKVLNIEALTMLDMVNKEILPAVTGYIKELCDAALTKRSLDAGISSEVETSLAARLSALSASLYKKTGDLNAALMGVKEHPDMEDCAMYYKDRVLVAMQETRAVADELETLTAKKCWPFPTYGDILFSV